MLFEWGSMVFCNLFLSNDRLWSSDGDIGWYVLISMKNMDLLVMKKMEKYSDWQLLLVNSSLYIKIDWTGMIH